VELTRHKLGIDATPQDVLRALRGDAAPFLLVGDWAGGGAIAGSEPLAAPLATEALAGPEGAVGGGWFGWLGYELGHQIERLPPSPPRPHPLPALAGRFYDHVLRLDAEGTWWFEAIWTPARAAALDARRAELGRRAGERRPWRLHGMRPRPPGYDGHRWAVRDAVRRIAEGELFQANLCLRLDGKLDGEPLDAFADASAALAPAHGAFFTAGEHAVLSFSPELFLRRTGGHAWSDPIKGTALGEAALTASEKDAAEHVMIVDLVRNDLGRVARYGSVIAHAPHVEAHPGLFHLVSRVEAEVAEAVSDADLIRAAFPPGSVTGAPKIQAQHVIAALEGSGREAYTGAMGFASPAAGLELNVAIRTLEVSGRHAWLGVGGGIVADSDPDAELAEALDKARPVLRALGAAVPSPSARRARAVPPPLDGPRADPALGLLETVLVLDGEPQHLDAHLARLGAPELRARAQAAAGAAGDGRHRLRIVLRPDGSADLATTPAGADPAPVHLVPVCLPGGLGDRKWADRRPVERWERPATGLLVDADGAVLEAAWGNVFLVEDGRYVTPPADGRLLPGVTRARLIGLVDAAEEEFDLGRLQAADAVLLTSAVALVTPVGAAAPLARELRRAMSAPSASAAPRAGLGTSPAPGR